MRFHSVATPHPNSNAVGPLELRCSAQELIVDHVSVRRRISGGPLGPVVAGSQTRIPWTEVRAECLDGDQLFLDLGPHRTPLNRFCLTRFSSSEHQGSTHHSSRPALWWLTALCFSVLFGVLGLGYWLPSASQYIGVFIAVGFATASILLLLLIGVATRHRLTLRPQSSRAALARLVAQLNEFLPRGVEGKGLGTRNFVKAASTSRLGGRPGAGWAIAAAVAATVLTAWFTWFEASPSSAPGVNGDKQASVATPSAPTPTGLAQKNSKPTASQALKETKLAIRPALATSSGKASAKPSIKASSDEGQALTLGTPCHCERPESPLWQQPIARLSTLILSRGTKTIKGRAQTRVQVAIVNNSNQNLRDLAVSVIFETPSTASSGLSRVERNTPVEVIRPLFYQGPLRPGRAVKWTVEGPGKNFILAPPELSSLKADGSDTAPSSEFMKLTDANSRSVRLHAARMLAYLGDTQAREVSETLLGANQPAEADYLHRIVDATNAVYSCDLKLSQNDDNSLRLTACLFNRTKQEASELAFTVRTLGGPVLADEPTGDTPASLYQSVWPLQGTLGPMSGKRVDLAFLPSTERSLPQHLEATVAVRSSSL